MTLGAVDYAASYFKFKTPTPIHGTPTNRPLKRLKSELRANVSSVELDLGGGNHRYLGLVLTDIEYANILPIPPHFNATNSPVALYTPLGASQVGAFTIREQHK